MILNEADIKIHPKPKGHPGFVDSEGRLVELGDIVAVRKDKTVRIAMVVKFTKTMVSCCPLYIERVGDNPDYINSRKHFYDDPMPSGVQKLRGIVKVELPNER